MRMTVVNLPRPSLNDPHTFAVVFDRIDGIVTDSLIRKLRRFARDCGAVSSLVMDGDDAEIARSGTRNG